MYKTRQTKVVCFLFSVLIFIVNMCAVNAEQHDNWDCPKCGRTGNVGNYCGGCGYPVEMMHDSEPELILSFKELPILSSVYPAVQTHFVSREERWYSQYGPGNDYAKTSEGYKTDNKHSNIISAFFCENDWVFADIVYSTASEKYAYIPLKSVAVSDQIPKISAADYMNGITTTDIIPVWGPGDSFDRDRGCEIKAGTTVRVFFIENDFAYSEFSCTRGKVRMWLPLDAISVSQV